MRKYVDSIISVKISSLFIFAYDNIEVVKLAHLP